MVLFAKNNSRYPHTCVCKILNPQSPRYPCLVYNRILFFISQLFALFDTNKNNKEAIIWEWCIFVNFKWPNEGVGGRDSRDFCWFLPVRSPKLVSINEIIYHLSIFSIRFNFASLWAEKCRLYQLIYSKFVMPSAKGLMWNL